ncbi:17631_t:CDS:2 [Funneliformis caledonium]|uniref:17631_t:CDS:1 n=1 Tax=Funneliformis caledonium TaxID=1117310 RepID=A0A9N8W8Q0_9GLOM|nr:17631_t:CDS:2 [Funneliformis caledonium]
MSRSFINLILHKEPLEEEKLKPLDINAPVIHFVGKTAPRYTNIVDTSGIFDTAKPNEEILEEIAHTQNDHNEYDLTREDENNPFIEKTGESSLKYKIEKFGYLLLKRNTEKSEEHSPPPSLNERANTSSNCMVVKNPKDQKKKFQIFPPLIDLTSSAAISFRSSAATVSLSGTKDNQIIYYLVDQ